MPRGLWWSEVPQKALRGGVPGVSFGKKGRFGSHFLTFGPAFLIFFRNLTFEILPRRALRGLGTGVEGSGVGECGAARPVARRSTY